MQKKKLTCPLTGCDFEIITTNDENPMFEKFLMNHPIEHYPFEAYVNERYELCIPLKFFEHIETVNATEAAQLLGVSRQRMSQLVNSSVLNAHMVNGSPVFKLDDVLAYKQERKPGRPKGK